MCITINQPDCVQVLLISGGESLEPEERVCKYSAGSSDSNPNFLSSVSSLESSGPPTSVDSHFERFFTRLLIQDVNPIGSRYGECRFNPFKRIRFLILFFLIRSRHKLFWRVYALKVKSLKWAHIEGKKKILWLCVSVWSKNCYKIWQILRPEPDINLNEKLDLDSCHTANW